MTDRSFFHSFPRRRPLETSEELNTRALSILSLMNKFGLFLAPELVVWDVGPIGREHLELLQNRACFTELNLVDISDHSGIFGPISLEFDLTILRSHGAMPVIYTPQGIDGGTLSHLATFCVQSAWHTEHVLKQLSELDDVSNIELVEKIFGRPMDPNATINLQNKTPEGQEIPRANIPVAHVRALMDYVGYRNIPFAHSIGMLEIFLHIFYPTDNKHSGEDLGYYRQREWRLVGSDISVGGRPISRPLSEAEISHVSSVDPAFWNRELTYRGQIKRRAEWARVYEPAEGWRFLDLVRAAYVPAELLDAVGAILPGRTHLLPS